MKSLLKKLRLIEDFNTELNISKSQFNDNLGKIVEKGSSNFISDFFDLFSRNDKQYKGFVDYSHFEITRKKRLFDMGFSFPKVKGKTEQSGDILVITTEINGFKGIMFFFLLFILLIYFLVIVAMFFSDTPDNNGEVFVAISIILLHACFVLGIPYFILRRSVKRFKYDLERELFYLTKNKMN